MKALSGFFVFGLFILILLWFRPYSYEQFSQGKTQMLFQRSHPLKPNGFMILHWSYARDYREQGWCVRAREPGKPEAWHLVLHEGADGEVVSAREEWWKR